MALHDARDQPAGDRHPTLELAGIVGNAVRQGIPGWRVMTALGVDPAQRSEIEEVLRARGESRLDV